MSNDVRTVFDAYKTTTLTFDCYGTLIDWESGAVVPTTRIGPSERFWRTTMTSTSLWMSIDVAPNAGPLFQNERCDAVVIDAGIAVSPQLTN
jgi:FMN phosphatase YigB (HAD superfamily)